MVQVYGLSISPKGLREMLHKVSKNFDPDLIRSGFDDEKIAPVLLFTIDNVADYGRLTDQNFWSQKKISRMLVKNN